MKNTNIYESNYNAYQPYMLLDFNISFEKDIAPDDICRTVMEVTERINLCKYVNFSNRNSYGYNGIMMFNLVILAKALFGYASTRDLERLCKTDIRFMFIAKNQKPSHQSFQRFIHDDLTMPIENIFYDINKYIEKHMDINTDVLCIDGTKYEANANKNTFIWRKNTLRNRMRRWQKTINCIKKINKYFNDEGIDVRYSLLKEPSIDYMLQVSDKLELYMKNHNIKVVHGKGCKKPLIQKLHEELKENALKMWEYTMHIDILGDRNSFSKTDPDATFMHMKYDYYNHTNVFKPGYNIQFGISDGIIRNIYISSDGNDIKTYIPFMDKYKEAYGTLPKITPADAGYGSYDNYSYCKENNIELYMKYSGYYKKKEKVTDKNRFKSIHFSKDEAGQIICPAGNAFELENETVDTRSMYHKINKKYINRHCKQCPFRNKCTKAKSGRTLTRCDKLEEYQKEVDNNLSSDEGKELMKKRSNESEGAFGDLKYNHKYDRLRRRGGSGVELEIYLVAIGKNLRKYHRYRIKKLEEEAKKSN